MGRVHGTGELIAAAAKAGAERVILAVGGSATTDGGAGALEALEEAGVEVEIDVLCDVRVPFERAPAVFGPQKGLIRRWFGASNSDWQGWSPVGHAIRAANR
jgi:glycerate kinase